MSGPLHFGINGVGLLGPGFAGWSEGRALLRGLQAWSCVPTVVPVPSRLAPTERRRAGHLIRACVAVADEACTMARLDPSTLPTVFTSSGGDPANCHAMCEALAQPTRTMSPTRFTNSVHNAAAGYWHIATRSRQPSTSLCAFDVSFAAGLLEAAAQCAAADGPMLLVACDLPYPEPLNALRPISDLFALALVLVPPRRGAQMQIELTLGAATPDSQCTNAALETVRSTIPAARALPLLQALAGDTPNEISVALQDELSLRLRVAP